MPNYRRYRVPGTCYFFTVNLLERKQTTLLTHIDLLRRAIRLTKMQWPFSVDAWVILPDHMHWMWTLPHGDNDVSIRWRLIKSRFSRQLPRREYRSQVRTDRGERGIWQRRFWEHVIRDEADYAAHMHYIHINPLKHGYVTRVRDWPHSSFHHWVQRGVYPENWAGDGDLEIITGERESRPAQ
ncbi:MAG: transposase [Gammaproteobacteria bacterium]|nr:transposase [Gammaproteobacteria bacterium]